MGDMSETRDELHRRDSSETEKKRYEPPKLTRVSLRPEEAVLGACKTVSTTGPVGNGVGTCAYPLPCPLPGS